MSLLLDLPKEIIEKIFIFSGNLKNLMQTSSVLSGLISTSSHLMQTFELHLCSKDHPLDLDIFLNSKRDYRRLWMKSGDTIPCEVWDILEKFGDTLNILKISNTFLKTNEFQRIIRTAEQLKVLELISVCYAQNMTISQLNQLELPNLRILRLFDSNFQLLSHLQNTIKLKSIEINDYLEKSEADIIFAINFLRSQLSLQDLIVQGIVVEQIFINDVSDIFNFQLLKLELTSFYTGQIDNVILTNMKRFLKNQSSLQMLKLHAGVDVDLIKIILYQLINLKRLYLNDVTFAEINMENLVDKNYSINRLHLKGNSEIYHSLINICRNLQDICFEDVHLNKEIMLAMYYNLNNLRKINFNRCKIENYMVLPTLKKVRFENMGKDQIRDFILFNRQLELIELPTQFEFDSVLNAIFLEFHGNLKAVTYHEQ